MLFALSRAVLAALSWWAFTREPVAAVTAVVSADGNTIDPQVPAGWPPTIDHSQWDPEQYRDSGCEIERIHWSDIEPGEFYQTYVKEHRPVIISGEPSCAAASAAVSSGDWSDDALSRLEGDRKVWFISSKHRHDSFFPGPMHPKGARHKRYESLDNFLQLYKDPDRTENWYLQSAVLPGLAQKLPRPSRLDESLQAIHCNEDGVLGEADSAGIEWCGRVWLGYSELGVQESHLHRDQGENLHCVVEGSKLFALIPPNSTSELPTGPLDVKKPQMATRAFIYSSMHVHGEGVNSVPGTQRCTVSAGEYLFLPALWWHSVVSLLGRNLGINFWYAAYADGEQYGWELAESECPQVQGKCDDCVSAGCAWCRAEGTNKGHCVPNRARECIGGPDNHVAPYGTTTHRGTEMRTAVTCNHRSKGAH